MLKLSVATWSSESEKFFHEALKQLSSVSKLVFKAGEFNCGTSSSLILLLFLLVSFGTFIRGGNVWKGIWGPFFSILKKPRQFGAFASVSEVLALGVTGSDSEFLR